MLSRTQLLQLFDKQKITYLIREHQPIISVAEGKALDLPELEAAVKSLLLTDDKHTTFYLIVLPISKELNLKVLRNLLASRRLTFANAEELHNLLQLHPGAVTPLGLLSDTSKEIHVYFDASLIAKRIAIPLLCNTATIWLSCDELCDLIRDFGHTISYIEL